MGQAAYKTLVKVSGTSTAFTDEPARAFIGGGISFRITDTVKRILDRSVAVVVKKDGAVFSSSNYTVDYLFGVITFTSGRAIDFISATITISGNYLPVLTVIGANQYSIDISGDVLDDTNFADTQSNGGFRTKLYGMLDVAVSMTRYDDLTKAYKTKLKDRDVVLIEIKLGDDKETVRGWFVIESVGSQGEINSLEMEDLSFQLDGNNSSAFSWRTN